MSIVKNVNNAMKDALDVRDQEIVLNVLMDGIWLMEFVSITVHQIHW